MKMSHFWPKSKATHFHHFSLKWVEDDGNLRDCKSVNIKELRKIMMGGTCDKVCNGVFRLCSVFCLVVKRKLLRKVDYCSPRRS